MHTEDDPRALASLDYAQIMLACNTFEAQLPLELFGPSICWHLE